MKKHLLWGIVGSLCLALPARAQFSQGTRYWGGTVSANGFLNWGKQERGDWKARGANHSIAPEIQLGKFINLTTMLGVGARYSLYWHGNRSSPGDAKSTYVPQAVSILPYFRKYKALNDRWSLFLHAEAGVSYHFMRRANSYQGQPIDEHKVESWQYLVSVKPGIVYHFPRKGWAIEGYADILHFSAMYQPNYENTSGFSISTGFTTNASSYLTLRIARYTNPKSN